MKRGKDRLWKTYKYKGDLAIYAKCDCGFEYACSNSKRKEDGSWSFEHKITKLYPYCPLCGARKKEYWADPVKSNELPPYMR